MPGRWTSLGRSPSHRSDRSSVLSPPPPQPSDSGPIRACTGPSCTSTSPFHSLTSQLRLRLLLPPTFRLIFVLEKTPSPFRSGGDAARTRSAPSQREAWHGYCGDPARTRGTQDDVSSGAGRTDGGHGEAPDGARAERVAAAAGRFDRAFRRSQSPAAAPGRAAGGPRFIAGYGAATLPAILRTFSGAAFLLFSPGSRPSDGFHFRAGSVVIRRFPGPRRP